VVEKTRRGAAKTRQPEEVAASLQWDDLRVFLVCVDEVSFRAAGRKLGMDVGSVTRRIERLEQTLHLQLFNRLSEGVRLTEEGRQLAQDAAGMARLPLDIIRRSQLQTTALRGLVRISVTDGLGTYWLLPRLLEFQRSNRLLTIDMQCTMLPTDVGRLQADISIQFARAERPDLIAVRLGYLHVYPFVSRSYVQHFGLPEKPADLVNHRIIHQVGPLVDESANELGLESIEGIIGFRTNSSTSVLYAVERDAGIGFLPNYASALASNLVPVDMHVKRRLEIWMTYHPNLKQSPRHMAVIEWLRKIFDARQFPCFGPEFVHPNELVSLSPDSMRINVVDGYAAASPLKGDDPPMDALPRKPRSPRAKQ
jgi:DNA-binding transcriptional LysR family regulator